MKKTAILIALALAACAGKPSAHEVARIDGSNRSTFSASVETIRDGMTDEEAMTFRYALKTIEMTRTDRGQWTGNHSVSPQMLSAVDGLSASQVLDLANQLRINYRMMR